MIFRFKIFLIFNLIIDNQKYYNITKRYIIVQYSLIYYTKQPKSVHMRQFYIKADRRSAESHKDHNARYHK